MIQQYIPGWVVLVFLVVERAFAAAAVMHAVMKKRETQSVIGWVGLIWLSPVIGSFLYLCFGINRIQRKGEKIQRKMDLRFRQLLKEGQFLDTSITRKELPYEGRLDEVVTSATGKPLVGGNNVTVLNGGETAYPSMIAAIETAQKSVALSSYIFDNDAAGRDFVKALSAAKSRGVEVRVLVDAIGARYSRPSIMTALAEAGIQSARFLPTLGPRLLTYANLRNHRKLLIVDGLVGFTGGMNIRASCSTDYDTSHQVKDVHFRFEGPVVSHLQEAFVTDWLFTTKEKLYSGTWFSVPERTGDVRARGIPDGPDSTLDSIRLTMLGAISVARHRIKILTPYFLPDETIISALNIAAMRGVKVQIVIPEVNNIKPVQWASADPLMRVLKRGCRVYLTPEPFDHTKVMLVDDCWSLVGSSNWDPRSLRLNFEFNVECYDCSLNAELFEITEKRIESAKRLRMEDLTNRPFLIRLRDGIARLATPYL
ncbi:cardiolipin synthase [Planctomicrobium sp. SH668]|uniref:cardiolipin synthase n=1 Tax=Planctomicrobium sp. SH668 TaxID=3448126 RepID=UPI003F5B9096